MFSFTTDQLMKLKFKLNHNEFCWESEVTHLIIYLPYFPYC